MDEMKLWGWIFEFFNILPYDCAPNNSNFVTALVNTID